MRGRRVWPEVRGPRLSLQHFERATGSGVRTEHNQLQVLTDLSIGKEVPGGAELELVNEYPPEVSLLFFSDGKIVSNSSNLPIQDLFLLFCQLLYLPRETS